MISGEFPYCEPCPFVWTRHDSLSISNHGWSSCGNTTRTVENVEAYKKKIINITWVNNLWPCFLTMAFSLPMNFPRSPSWVTFWVFIIRKPSRRGLSLSSFLPRGTKRCPCLSKIFKELKGLSEDCHGKVSKVKESTHDNFKLVINTMWTVTITTTYLKCRKVRLSLQT